MSHLRSSVAASALALALAAPSLAFAGVTIEIAPSSAPNGFGSPSWAPYAANALNALQNGLGNVGDRNTDPTAYEVLDSFTPGDVMVTSFNSWRGQANPPVPFASELGNRLHFGLHAYGDGLTQFSLDDVSFEIHSGDPSDALVFVGDLSGTTLNGTTRIGIDWGLDNARGGGDDTIFNANQNDDTLMDELMYVGVGNAYWPGGPGDPLTGQAAIDAAFDYINDTVNFISGSYSIIGTDQQVYSATVTLYQTPEPAALGLLGLGLVGLALSRRPR